MLKDIKRSSRFFLFFCGCTEYRLRQRAAVDLLILVQRNGFYLHRCSRHHIRRLLIHDEAVQCLDVYLFIGHDVCGNVFSASRIVESLNGSILDARELSDYSFHFLKLNAETANLYLTVFAAYEFDITIVAIAHDIASTIDALPLPLYEGCCRLLGLVQITYTHLRTSNNQFTAASPRHLFSETVHNIQFSSIVRLANRNIRLILINIMTANIAGSLSRTIGIEQMVGRRIKAHQLLTARSQILELSDVGI